jgi:glycosyltransferase involved in cell wall biosynthesis
MTRRVLLLEPFLGGSHEAWARGWQAASDHEIHIIGHAARAWRWRMRGAAVSLAAETDDWVAAHGHPDLVVATDMLDLAAYLGLARRTIGAIPAAIYLHENQLTYPRRPGEPLDSGLAWATWRSLLAADAVWFNSEFHRRDLFAALPGFLASVPDHDHVGLLDVVSARSAVLPVGVDLTGLTAAEPRPADPDGPLVLSNQRWHHDKNLGSVVRVLRRLADESIAFRVALVGDDRGGERDELQPLVDALGDRIVQAGHLPRDEYLELLKRSDIVVSAARNEFFGIAVVEAIAAGLVPVLPDGLAYPEIVPEQFHRDTLYAEAALCDALRSAITGLAPRRAALTGLSESVRRYDWPVVGPAYDRAVDELIAGG